MLLPLIKNGKKVCIGVLSSDEIGRCGIEHDWVSTAVSVEENSKGELSHRRRKAGGEKCVLLGTAIFGLSVPRNARSLDLPRRSHNQTRSGVIKA